MGTSRRKRRRTLSPASNSPSPSPSPPRTRRRRLHNNGSQARTEDDHESTTSLHSTTSTAKPVRRVLDSDDESEPTDALNDTPPRQIKNVKKRRRSSSSFAPLSPIIPKSSRLDRRINIRQARFKKRKRRNNSSTSAFSTGSEDLQTEREEDHNLLVNGRVDDDDVESEYEPTLSREIGHNAEDVNQGSLESEEPEYEPRPASEAPSEPDYEPEMFTPIINDTATSPTHRQADTGLAPEVTIPVISEPVSHTESAGQGVEGLDWFVMSDDEDSAKPVTPPKPHYGAPNSSAEARESSLIKHKEKWHKLFRRHTTWYCELMGAHPRGAILAALKAEEDAENAALVHDDDDDDDDVDEDEEEAAIDLAEETSSSIIPIDPNPPSNPVVYELERDQNGRRRFWYGNKVLEGWSAEQRKRPARQLYPFVRRGIELVYARYHARGMSGCKEQVGATHFREQYEGKTVCSCKALTEQYDGGWERCVDPECSVVWYDHGCLSEVELKNILTFDNFWVCMRCVARRMKIRFPELRCCSLREYQEGLIHRVTGVTRAPALTVVSNLPVNKKSTDQHIIRPLPMYTYLLPFRPRLALEWRPDTLASDATSLAAEDVQPFVDQTFVDHSTGHRVFPFNGVVPYPGYWKSQLDGLPRTSKAKNYAALLLSTRLWTVTELKISPLETAGPVFTFGHNVKHEREEINNRARIQLVCDTDQYGEHVEISVRLLGCFSERFRRIAKAQGWWNMNTYALVGSILLPSLCDYDIANDLARFLQGRGLFFGTNSPQGSSVTETVQTKLLKMSVLAHALDVPRVQNIAVFGLWHVLITCRQGWINKEFLSDLRGVPLGCPARSILQRALSSPGSTIRRELRMSETDGDDARIAYRAVKSIRAALVEGRKDVDMSAGARNAVRAGWRRHDFLMRRGNVLDVNGAAVKVFASDPE